MAMLLNIQQAAERLACSVATVRRIVDRSKRALGGCQVGGPTIRFFQPGPHSPVRFREEWIDEFINTATVVEAPVVVKRVRKPAAVVGSDLLSEFSDLVAI